MNKVYLSKAKSIILIVITVSVFLISNNLLSMELFEEESFNEIIERSSSTVFTDFVFQIKEDHSFSLQHFLGSNGNLDTLGLILEEIFRLFNLDISQEAKSILLFFVNNYSIFRETLLEMLRKKYPDETGLIELLIKIGAYITIELTQEEKSMPDKVDALLCIRERILEVQRQFPRNGIIVNLSRFLNKKNRFPDGFWEGLTNVVELDLTQNNLLVIPSGIKYLTKLQDLNLSFNQLTQEGIRSVCQLTGLRKLEIAANLTDIPFEIKYLTKLQDLRFSDNYLTQEGIRNICQLSGLRKLDLSWNGLTNLPSEIGNLEELQVFDLMTNQLTKLPAEIMNLKRLQDLHLSWNFLKQNAVRSICQLTNLRRLDLAWNSLTTLPSEIINLKRLRILELSCNDLVVLFDRIEELTELRELRLSGNDCLKIEALRSLYWLENLKRLTLEKCSGLHDCSALVTQLKEHGVRVEV